MSIDFEKIKQDALESKLQEQEDLREQPISLGMAMRILRTYPRWYLRKNQPGNYFRITRIIPTGFSEQPYFWRHMLQLWKPGQIIFQELIDASTYDHIRSLPGWELSTNTENEIFYTFKNPKS